MALYRWTFYLQPTTMTTADIKLNRTDVNSATFKILAADKLATEGLAFLEAQKDVQLTYKPGMSEDELAAIVGEHDGLIVRSGVQVTAKVLENPGRLKVVARAGVGVDNIDLDAATAKGVLVVNTAEASTITTAEHAFALLMALARNVGPAYKKMTEGGWDRGKFEGRQLSGKTLGVVGFGRIGRTVAQRALAFDMRVVAFDPLVRSEVEMDGAVKMYRVFAEMLPHVDILTFHVPLNDQTRGMLNDETFALCRDGVLVVNAARGGVVDEAALLTAVQSGKCAGAALDVFSNEPPPANDPLRHEPHILVTPHLGASTIEAQQAVSVGAAEALLAYLRGQEIRGAVNAGGLRLDLDPEQAAFVDLAGRMTQLVAPMITHGIASVTFELSSGKLSSVAPTIERMGLIGLLSGHMTMPLNVVNVTHVAKQYGIALRTVLAADESEQGRKLTIEVKGANGEEVRRIVGCVYHDLRPRVIEINGYHMDMVPAGHMVLIQNEDRPGMIGMVGEEFGKAAINIADMAISRRDTTALMVLKIDEAPSAELLERLKSSPGILKTAAIKLPPERQTR